MNKKAKTKAMKDEPAIHCSHSKVVSLDKLRPNPRNPNTHPERQIDLLAKIIKQQGWRRPIVVSKRSGYIVAGHGRLQAAIKAGCKVAPVDMQDYASEALEYADLLADNHIAELAEMDNAMMKDLLQDLDSGDMDMDLTGFDEKELESIMTATMPDDKTEQGNMVTCPSCGKVFAP